MDESLFPITLPPVPDLSEVELLRRDIPPWRDGSDQLQADFEVACAEFEKDVWDYSQLRSQYADYRRLLQDAEQQLLLLLEDEQLELQEQERELQDRDERDTRNEDQLSAAQDELSAIEDELSAANFDMVVEYRERLMTVKRLAGDALMRAEEARNRFSTVYSALQARLSSPSPPPEAQRRSSSPRPAAGAGTGTSAPNGQANSPHRARGMTRRLKPY